ncbi:glycosyltransferase family 2 protein [Marivirga tractuosa]|uniref:glycosyltransferase family 2 protein n=1 Tax=Marivirga tractuosa TaxID=1006 RepID=UPI0035CEC8E3
MSEKQVELVSVCMVTYKHEADIREAIEGVLSQKTDFKVSLLVGDDCSPDNTYKIVKDIIINHPNGHWITYIKREKNIGMMPNFIDLLKRCKGKYIALCDGDDFWTDPLKLHKQVNFLDKNKKNIFIGHSCHGLTKSNKIVPVRVFTTDHKITPYKVFLSNQVNTSTFLFRNHIVNYEELINFNSGDLPLLTMLAFKGDLYVFSDAMSIYRMNGKGADSSLRMDIKYSNYLKNRKLLLKHFQWSNISLLKVMCYSLLRATIYAYTIFNNNSPARTQLKLFIMILRHLFTHKRFSGE